MKRILLAASLVLAASTVLADDLSDARKLFEKQDYQAAATAYQKLADKGNAEAQFLLGEMHWYGEAGKIDLMRAEGYFKMAAAQGHPKAQAALKAMAARVARLAEIEKYSKTFFPAALAYENAKCARPEFPANSRTKKEIREVDGAFRAWHACHSGYVARLNEAASPVEKAIPKDLADLMTEDDLQAARAKMGQVYQDLASQANLIANEVTAAHGKWLKSTEAYVQEAEAARVAGIKAREIEMNNASARGALDRSPAPSSGFSSGGKNM